jgi:hypothetical protein
MKYPARFKRLMKPRTNSDVIQHSRVVNWTRTAQASLQVPCTYLAPFSFSSFIYPHLGDNISCPSAFKVLFWVEPGETPRTKTVGVQVEQ